MRGPAAPPRSGSAARRRRASRARAAPTRAPTARAAPPASASLGVRLPLLDELDDSRGGLLDRQLRDVEHGAAEPAVDRARVLELLVDLDQLRVRPGRRAHVADAFLPDLDEPARID